MSTKDNIRILNEALDAFNSHDMAGFVKNMAESIVDYIPGRPEPLRGPDAIRNDNSSFLTIFPDAHFKKTNEFGQGNWVCIQGVFEATHEGPFPVPGGQPIPPTGKKLRVSQCMVAKLDEGKIIEIYEYFNPLDFLSQLGMTM